MAELILRTMRKYLAEDSIKISAEPESLGFEKTSEVLEGIYKFVEYERGRDTIMEIYKVVGGE